MPYKNLWKKNIRRLFNELFVSFRTTAYHIIDCRIYHLLSASLVQTVQTDLFVVWAEQYAQHAFDFSPDHSRWNRMSHSYRVTKGLLF